MPEIKVTELPPLVDAPYVVGAGGHQQHAIARTRATTLYERHRSGYPVAPAVCGEVATPIQRWGAFTPDNPLFTIEIGFARCPHCAWLLALEQGTEAAELAMRTPAGTDLEVLARLLPDPMITIRIYEAILAQPRDYASDHPHLAQLLSHVTAHAPQIVIPEDCVDGDCGHDRVGDTWHCSYPDATLGCARCSVCAGSWAGVWEGQYATECTVPAPCEVLRTIAAHYDIAMEGDRHTREPVVPPSHHRKETFHSGPNQSLHPPGRW